MGGGADRKSKKKKEALTCQLVRTEDCSSLLEVMVFKSPLPD